MKNVILIDPSLYILDAIMSYDDVFVPVLVVDSNIQKELISKYAHRIGSVIYRCPSTYEEFFNTHESDYNITKEDIELYRHAQLKAEHYSQREILDSADAQYRYFVGLTFFLGIFEKYAIDLVFSTRSEHGATFDSVPFEIAKKNNIPVYCLDVCTGNLTYDVYAIHHLNDNTYINLSQITKHYASPKLDEYAHKFNVSVFKQKKKSVLEFIKYLKRLLNMYLKNATFNGVNVYTKYFRKSFQENTTVFDYPGNTSADEVMQNKVYVKKIQKLYNKISEKPQKNEKYIFYALHFEPEATIMNRDAFSNQLMVIKLLAQSLPQGWKLYVKEHISQFSFEGGRQYLARNIFLFRTEQFYRNIIDNKNVRLISHDESSQALQANAQAISSICGSVIFESIMKDKPVLIFGSSSSIFTKCKDAFVIYSKDDVVNAVKCIENGFLPQYNDVSDIARRYLFEIDMKEFVALDKNKGFLMDIFNHLLNLKNN